MKLDYQNYSPVEIIGIVSMGGHGCVSIVPNIYVKVSEYVPWIQRNLENFTDSYYAMETSKDGTAGLTSRPTDPNCTEFYIMVFFAVALFFMVVMLAYKLSKAEKTIQKLQLSTMEF